MNDSDFRLPTTLLRQCRPPSGRSCIHFLLKINTKRLLCIFQHPFQSPLNICSSDSALVIDASEPRPRKSSVIAAESTWHVFILLSHAFFYAFLTTLARAVIAHVWFTFRGRRLSCPIGQSRGPVSLCLRLHFDWCTHYKVQ
jgi:hypothetical protein